MERAFLCSVLHPLLQRGVGHPYPADFQYSFLCTTNSRADGCLPGLHSPGKAMSLHLTSDHSFLHLFCLLCSTILSASAFCCLPLSIIPPCPLLPCLLSSLPSTSALSRISSLFAPLLVTSFLALFMPFLPLILVHNILKKALATVCLTLPDVWGDSPQAAFDVVYV